MKIPKVKKPSKEVLAKVHSLKKEKGKIAVIEPDSGDYFLGKTLLEALNKPGFDSYRVNFSKKVHLAWGSVAQTRKPRRHTFCAWLLDFKNYFAIL